MLVTCTSTFQLDFFHYSGVGMQRIYLSYLKPSLVSCQQLWFISPSKIGLFIDRWIKKQLSAGNCRHIHPRLRYLFSSYCIFWDQQTAWNSWPRSARNDWNRFGSCFCFNCNSICYSISLWSSG